MITKNQLASLPKIEVSFQDYFAGTLRDITLTPQYILRKLTEMNIEPKLGSEILLYEQDGDEYLCYKSKIVEITKDVLTNYTNAPLSIKEFSLIDGKPVFMPVDYTKLSRFKVLPS